MKIKSLKTNKEMNLAECKKPKFSSHRGRTWDCFYIKINNTFIKCFLDTTWGFYAYFEFHKKWYKGKLVNFEDVMKQNDLWLGCHEFSEFSRKKELT